MVDSRLRLNPPSIFHCFVRVVAPLEDRASYVETTFPEQFEEKDGILKGITAFCFPCSIDHDGVQYSTFVLTDIENLFRYGYCRYPPHADHCLCVVSYFPWFQTFYGVLDKIAQLNTKDNLCGVLQFLEALHEQSIPSPGSTLYFHFNNEHSTQSFKVGVPDTTKLPSIPEDRNLTQYFAKVTPENMVNLFISMLFERRIIICSDKLSTLTAVIHGSVSLLYPMQWQHIFIPILPTHLIDYCCAPMPFLLGVHGSMMEKVHRMPLSEVVIFNADTNEIIMLEDDLDVFPSKISSKLKRKLRHVDRAYGDYVSRQFLNCLADVMGGYRDGLKYMEAGDGEKIVFDDDMFVNSRTGSTRLFLEAILSLQLFRQFIAGRLEKLNDDQALEDMFERTVNQRSLDAASQTNYSHLKDKMRKGGGALKKGGVALKKTVDGKTERLKEMAHDIDTREIKKKIKDKVKDVKDIMQIGQKEPYGDLKDKTTRKSWSPTLKTQITQSPSPHSQSPSNLSRTPGAPQRPRRPPPQRPPRPSSEHIHRHNLLLEQHSDPSSTTTTNPFVQQHLPTKTTNPFVQRDPSTDPPSSNSSASDIPTLLELSGDRDDISATVSLVTSDSDSSIEPSEGGGGLENLAFTEPSNRTSMNIDIQLTYDNDNDNNGNNNGNNRESLINFKSPSPTEEDLIFEQSPILPRSGLQNTHTSRNNGNAMTSYQNPVLKKFEKDELFYKPKVSLNDYSEADPEREGAISAPPSITRQRYVSGKKPMVPPRPRLPQQQLLQQQQQQQQPLQQQEQQQQPQQQPHQQQDKRQVPSRPPMSPKLKECRDLIFDTDVTSGAPSTTDVRRGPSPVTTLPSADLLGLEQSLFHETMKAMSDDTRSLLDDTRTLSLSTSTPNVNNHGNYGNNGNNGNPGNNGYQGNGGNYSNNGNYGGIHGNPGIQGGYSNQGNYRYQGQYGYQGNSGYQGNYMSQQQQQQQQQQQLGNYTNHGSYMNQGNGLTSARTSNIRTFFEKGDTGPPVTSSLSGGRVTDSKVVNSTSPRDPFENCLEEAKNMKYIPR